MIRVFAHILFLHAFFLCSGQSSTLTDGPYVFYGKDYLVIKSITNGQLKKDSAALHSARNTLLTVTVSAQPGVSFNVPIKRNLQPEASTYRSADNLLALSDIEGTFEGLNKLLLSGGVIDNQFNWIFGKGHLVICGDMFDRGEDVTACLWLLYKLEDEAKAKGGHVHVILGNHEIMNMSEDFRYVNAKYNEAASLMGTTYKELYTANTELGRWLRTKNIMERIGNYLFLHGGVSQPINQSGLSLDEINDQARPYYQMSGFDSVLNEAHVLPLFSGDTAPFWYRGYFLQPQASMAQIDSTLNLFNVKRIVVGHNIVDSIQTRYEGKIIAIDVNYHLSNYQALVINGKDIYRINAAGEMKKLN